MLCTSHSQSEATLPPVQRPTFWQNMMHFDSSPIDGTAWEGQTWSEKASSSGGEDAEIGDVVKSASSSPAIKIYPRRKGAEPRLERGKKRDGVLVTKEYLLSCFGRPLQCVASKLVSIMLSCYFAFAVLLVSVDLSYGTYDPWLIRICF